MSEETNRQEEPIDPVESMAAEWILKFDRGLTGEEQDALFDWLAADPSHAEAYQRRRREWSELDIFAQWKPEHSREPNPDLLADFRSAKAKGLPRIPLAIAAGLVLAFGLWGFLRLNSPEQLPLFAIETPVSSYQRHVLQDGSIIELNRGSRISVSYDADSRKVELLSGEAHFTVSKNSLRPFVVSAGSIAVEAIGTAFNVEYRSDSVEVLVTEGRVRLGRSNTSDSLDSLSITTEKTDELVAGQKTVVGDESTRSPSPIETISPSDIVKRLAWKSGLLQYTERSLSKVVADFNLYNDTQIIIVDQTLAERKITAALRPNDIDAFTGLLELTLNVQVERLDSQTIQLRERR